MEGPFIFCRKSPGSEDAWVVKHTRAICALERPDLGGGPVVPSVFCGSAPLAMSD